MEELRNRRLRVRRLPNHSRSVLLDPEPQQPEGGNSMADGANGNVNPADIATLSLLGRPYGYGGGGYGGGPWGAGGGGYGGYGGHSMLGPGNSNLAAEAHANGTAVNAKIEGNGERINAQTQMFDSAERSRQFGDLKDSQTEERLSTQASSFELRQAIADNAKEAAKCCCETNLEATKNSAALKADILAVESRQITRELDRAERKIESSDSTNAIVGALRDQSAMLVSILQGVNGGHGGHRAVA